MAMGIPQDYYSVLLPFDIPCYLKLLVVLQKPTQQKQKQMLAGPGPRSHGNYSPPSLTHPALRGWVRWAAQRLSQRGA